MKIIQIIAAVNGESPGSFESQLLGLGDDGGLYEYVWPRQAHVRKNGVNQHSKNIPETHSERALLNLTYHDGTTQGWQLICMSIDRPKSLPHPLDPTRNERQ
jgi:hypothetical protein